MVVRINAVGSRTCGWANYKRSWLPQSESISCGDGYSDGGSWYNLAAFVAFDKCNIDLDRAKIKRFSIIFTVGNVIGSPNVQFKGSTLKERVNFSDPPVNDVVVYDKPFSSDGQDKLKIETMATKYEMKKILGNGFLLDLVVIPNSGALDTKYSFYSHIYPEPDKQPYIEIDYEDDSTPSRAEINSPIGSYINGNEDTIFSWIYMQEMGSVQSHFELQYRQPTSSWTAWVAKTQSGNPFYNSPADTLPSGQLEWRVKTYSLEGAIASEWSTPATIVVRSRPPLPNITNITNAPRPTINWQSLGQQAFEVKAGAFQSGIVYGTHKQFKVPVYLEDGETVVSLRIQNNFGLWSAWAEIKITIENVPSTEITLSALAENNAILLSWTGDYLKYYIYRDDQLIGKTEQNTYTDPLCIGQHSYYIKGVTAEDYYTSSNKALATLNVRFGLLSSVNDIDWLACIFSRGGLITQKHDLTQNVSYQHYSGRTLPVANVSPNVTSVYNYSVSFFEPESVRKLKKLLGKTVIYKDNRENLVIGVIDNISTSNDWATDASFSITQIDTLEGIVYD